MKKILLSAVFLGTVAAAVFVYVQYMANEKHIEDPTQDIWH